MDSHQQFSSDIMFEILSRTPSLKTLDACKLVSKEWQQLIYESSFMPTYCKRTNNVFGYFIQDMRPLKYLSMFVSLDQSNNTSIEKMPCDMRIMASCNQGILCCEREIDHRNVRYYVCKPTTRQWQHLPNPKTRYLTDAIAVMVLKSSPYVRYKIIRLSQRRIHKYTDDAHYRCEVFDSKFWTWREEKDLLLPCQEFITNTNPAIVTGDTVHWLTYKDNVIVFDQANNSFNKFSLPEPVYKNESYNHKQLVEYQGKLGLTCLTEQSNMELWIVADRRNNEWTKKMAVNLENIGNTVSYPSPAGFCNADIAFMKACYEVVFYKVQDCSYNVVKLDGLIYARECFQVRSDFESVNLRGPRISKIDSEPSSCRCLFILCLCFLVACLLCCFMY